MNQLLHHKSFDCLQSAAYDIDEPRENYNTIGDNLSVRQRDSKLKNYQQGVDRT